MMKTLAEGMLLSRNIYNSRRLNCANYLPWPTTNILHDDSGPGNKENNLKIIYAGSEALLLSPW